jgi:hypothetical protein
MESVKKYNKLAWAFLLPVGQAGHHLPPNTLTPPVNVGLRHHIPSSEPKRRTEAEAETSKEDEISEQEDNHQSDFDLPLRLQLYQYQ